MITKSEFDECSVVLLLIIFEKNCSYNSGKNSYNRENYSYNFGHYFLNFGHYS